MSDPNLAHRSRCAVCPRKVPAGHSFYCSQIGARRAARQRRAAALEAEGTEVLGRFMARVRRSLPVTVLAGTTGRDEDELRTELEGKVARGEIEGYRVGGVLRYVGRALHEGEVPSHVEARRALTSEQRRDRRRERESTLRERRRARRRRYKANQKERARAADV